MTTSNGHTAPAAAHTYDGHPVEILADFNNGITRVRLLDAGRPSQRKLRGESAAERYWRIASHGVWDVATTKIVQGDPS